MSGIAGVYRPDAGEVDEASLQEMVDAIAHRGPDGQGIWRDGNVGLCHLMLHTTPESVHAELPLHRNGLVITADARIDNRAELIEALKLKGEQDLPDAELILAAYQEWGDECPERLIGAFAFTIWDARANRLFCARDHIGIRPFYYHDRAGTLFAVGSAVTSLLALDSVTDELDEVRIGEYLVPIFNDTERTFYREVRRLPPAHAMSVTEDGCSKWRYWNPDPWRELAIDSDAAYADQFRELFTEAVRCRLRSNRRIGSLLSGGLDSTSVACVARDMLQSSDGGGSTPLQSTLPTFSLVFDEVPESDEREYIGAVIGAGGFDPTFIRGDIQKPITTGEKLVADHALPYFNPQLFLFRPMYREAAEDNVRIILEGAGGDVVVSHGRGYLAELAKRGRWIRLTREVRGLQARHGDSTRQTLMGQVVAPLAPEPVRNLYRRVSRKSEFLERMNPNISQNFAQRINLESRSRDFGIDTPYPASERERHLDRIIEPPITSVIEEYNRTAARFGVEPRFPFLDRRLIEFCLALPPRQKIHHGWTRNIMREALSDLLPPKIRWRGGKTYLGANFEYVLTNRDRDRLRSLLVEDAEIAARYLDYERLCDLFGRVTDDESKCNHDEFDNIWFSAMLIAWLRNGSHTSTFTFNNTGTMQSNEQNDQVGVTACSRFDGKND